MSLHFSVDRYWPAMNITCNFFINFSCVSWGYGQFYFKIIDKIVYLISWKRGEQGIKGIERGTEQLEKLI